MKKFMSIIIIMMMIVCSVNAFPVQAAKIIMKGNTSTDAFGVTTLLVNASADINNVKAEDVFYFNFFSTEQVKEKLLCPHSKKCK